MNKEYAVKGFDLEAVDYLVKPVKFERFVIAPEKAAKRLALEGAAHADTAQDSIFVKSGYGTVRANVNEIKCIEGLDDYVKIHFINDQRPVLSLMSLKGILDKLPEEDFMRLHRSFITALKHVRSVRKKTISLEKGTIPIGDTYVDTVKSWLSEF